MTIGAGALDRILSQLRALVEARRRGGKANAAAAASAVAVFYLALVFRQGRRPKLVCRRSGHNVRVLRALAGLIDRPYYPSWLTPNAHVNCLLGYAKGGMTVSRTRELVRCWGKHAACGVVRHVRARMFSTETFHAVNVRIAPAGKHGGNGGANHWVCIFPLSV